MMQNQTLKNIKRATETIQSNTIVYRIYGFVGPSTPCLLNFVMTFNYLFITTFIIVYHYTINNVTLHVRYVVVEHGNFFTARSILEVTILSFKMTFRMLYGVVVRRKHRCHNFSRSNYHNKTRYSLDHNQYSHGVRAVFAGIICVLKTIFLTRIVKMLD